MLRYREHLTWFIYFVFALFCNNFPVLWLAHHAYIVMYFCPHGLAQMVPVGVLLPIDLGSILSGCGMPRWLPHHLQALLLLGEASVIYPPLLGSAEPRWWWFHFLLPIMYLLSTTIILFMSHCWRTPYGFNHHSDLGLSFHSRDSPNFQSRQVHSSITLFLCTRTLLLILHLLQKDQTIDNSAFLHNLSSMQRYPCSDFNI